MIDYPKIARQSRIKCLELVFNAQTSHIGSLFSCADILAVLFEKIDLNKDQFILSAGWKACMLYYHLWRKGRITEKELNSYCQPESKFIGLAEPIIPEIPFAGGSMCMGVAAGVGFALAKKLKKEQGKIYVLESDGGMQGGITWEAALIAAQYRLDNLIVICDYNKLQAMGKIIEILDIEPLVNKWNSFGWRTKIVDGHQYYQIESTLEDTLEYSETKPTIIIANTIKGKGVYFMQDNNLYHYKQLNNIEYEKAKEELSNI